MRFISPLVKVNSKLLIHSNKKPNKPPI